MGPLARVLVVNSGAARSALRAPLEPFGFAVEEAEDGALALQRLEVAPFESVFVELVGD